MSRVHEWTVLGEDPTSAAMRLNGMPSTPRK